MNTSGSSQTGEVELPDHVRGTIDTIAELGARAYQDTTQQQRAIEGLTKRLGRPIVVYIVLAFVAGWIVANVALGAAGHDPFDRFPYPALQGLITLSALVMTILILTTETRLGHISDRRARLGVQMGVLTEQKITKVIELLEQHRRDDPNQHDRVDPEAQAMAESVDPAAVQRALDEAHNSIMM